MNNELERKGSEARFLGMGPFPDAFGPVVAIPVRLLDGCRLILTTDAGEWSCEEKGIRKAVDEYSSGLRVISVQMGESEYETVVILEGVPKFVPKPIRVNGRLRTPAHNTYVLATPFAGEYYILLEAEDSAGNRKLLWGDDFIDK